MNLFGQRSTALPSRAGIFDLKTDFQEVTAKESRATIFFQIIFTK